MANTRISPLLSGLALAGLGIGVASGLVDYLHRSPVRQEQHAGTAAWLPHIVLAAVLLVLFGFASWRHGPGVVLAPVGRRASARLATTARSWRIVLALAPLAVFGYACWRVGEQVTGGLDANFTINAWGGPTYLGAMTCHYLDAAVGMVACGWLLNKVLLPAR